MLSWAGFLWLLWLEPALRMSILQRTHIVAHGLEPAFLILLASLAHLTSKSFHRARSEWTEVRAGAWPWSNKEESPS